MSTVDLLAFLEQKKSHGFRFRVDEICMIYIIVVVKHISTENCQWLTWHIVRKKITHEKKDKFKS